MRQTMRGKNNAQNIRKTMNLRDNAAMLKSKSFRDKDELENENPEEDDFGGKTIKKRLRIRLTDEEYRLLLKLKAKKKSAQEQQ